MDSDRLPVRHLYATYPLSIAGQCSFDSPLPEPALDVDPSRHWCTDNQRSWPQVTRPLKSQWTVSQIPPRSQEPPPFRRTTSSNHPKGLIRRQLAINRPQQMVGNLLSWEIPSFQYPVGFGTRRLWIVREPVGPSACNRLAAAGSWQPSVSRSR